MDDTEMIIMPIIRPITDHQNFNDIEGRRFMELMGAVHIMKRPKNHVIREIQCRWDAKQVSYELLDRQIRDFTNFTLNLSEFNKICENDKISLVKYGCIEIINMRSVLFYDFDNQFFNIWINDKTSVRLNLNTIKSGHQNERDIHDIFLDLMSTNWENDSYIIDLLTGIALFNPNRPKLCHISTIKLTRYIYMCLLYRYLIVKYRSEIAAQNKFVRLMKLLRTNQELGDRHRTIRSHENPQLTTPLVCEVFDIPVKTDVCPLTQQNQYPLHKMISR
ncbi:nuclear hormone receptor HR96-like [Oppia nitens]|uniref:nuclear hormone receptor HR96-like n=1 Tax=Oppia nitens TaxID=1686743 RepID=UPI0023DB0CDF|nr:nuclear hormone receptor HR96-like [Oppia nitens]